MGVPWCGGFAGLWSLGCGSLPVPPPVPPPETDFVETLAPPPPARVEVVTPRPDGARFWVDGSWKWEGSRWKWALGGWFSPPPGVRYADWQVKRREDGTLLYANAVWLDARGTPMAGPAPLGRSQTIGGGSDEEKPPPLGEGDDQKPPAPGQAKDTAKPGEVLGADNGKKP